MSLALLIIGGRTKHQEEKARQLTAADLRMGTSRYPSLAENEREVIRDEVWFADVGTGRLLRVLAVQRTYASGVAPAHTRLKLSK